MVVNRRLLLAITTAASLVLAAAVPVSAAYKEADPNPLRKENLLRVRDIEARAGSIKHEHGPVVAIGWREASGTKAQLYFTFSLNGGKTFRKDNGTMRKARVVGNYKAGMSLDVCGGRVWVGTAVSNGGSVAATDVVLTSRDLDKTPDARQSYVTTGTQARKVNDVSVACVGDRLLAISWLEQSGGKDRVRLVLRSLERPGDTPSYSRKWGLGDSRFKGGLDVAATGDAVHVAWTRGTAQDLAYKRLLIGDEAKPTITKKATRVVDKGAASNPQLASHGTKVALAYIDAGRVKAKVSDDTGASFAKGDILVTGTKKRPSRVHSVDIVSSRIAVGATANKDGRKVSTRVISNDQGKTWGSQAFGNNGTRMVALLKRGSKADPVLRETWHNSVPGKDTLRARYQTS